MIDFTSFYEHVLPFSSLLLRLATVRPITDGCRPSLDFIAFSSLNEVFLCFSPIAAFGRNDSISFGRNSWMPFNRAMMI